jgi:hypothetical protein
MRLLIGSVFLLAQLFSVIYAQFSPTRYFCWAPNDYMVEYRLNVDVNGRALTPQEILLRYRKPSTGIYQNIVRHLEDHVRQYETTYGLNDHAHVLLTYSTNGGERKEWKWPQQ